MRSFSSRIPTQISELSDIEPVIHVEWWRNSVKYSTFSRQGIDIFCASFINPDAKANIIFVTGWNESFLKYAELFKTLYEAGYSVYTYDHQSQGLSGRWLMDEQYTWMYSFDDYVQDFVFFVNQIEQSQISSSKIKGKDEDTKNDNHLEKIKIPTHCICHSMGGLVVGVAITKYPTLIDRIAFSAPAFRFKCGMKCMDYQGPLPLPIAYIINSLAVKFGFGQFPLLGSFKEDPAWPVTRQLSTDSEQLELQRQLRMKYPYIISCCGTYKWCLNCFDAQEAFAKMYSSVRAKCLIFKVANDSDDVFVHGRAMDLFAQAVPSCKIFEVEGKHEVLLETKVRKSSLLFFHHFIFLILIQFLKLFHK